jgi:hypothetical protein
MTRATTPTKLSLDRYAKIMGINPVHFSQAQGATGDNPIFPLGGGCSDVWWQETYQHSDHVSREDLARAIYGAEQDIEDYLGYPIAPEWIVEVLNYPRNYRRTEFGLGRNVRLDRKSLILSKGKFIAAGRRYTQLVGEATIGGGTIVRQDPDGDTFFEVFRVRLPTPAWLTSASTRQIRVYQDGEDTRPYEITDPISVEIDATWTTLYFYFWQFIDPALQFEFPSAALEALDIDDDIYIDTVDVYREYTDYSQHSVEFFWEPRVDTSVCATCGGSGCVACQLTVQCGCLHVRDVHRGIAVPQPASWNATDADWDNDTFTLCYEPDQVKVWYYAGDMSDDYVNGRTVDPLKRSFAEAIAWMATARLERNFCACGNLTALATNLRRDLTLISRDSTYAVPDKVLDNPFGTRKGEVDAWRRISRLKKARPKVAVI